MKERFLFFEDNCPFCDMYLNIIDLTNSRLKPSDNIILKNVSALMVVGVQDDPLIEKYKIDSVPILILDGRRIVGVSSKEWIKGFLNSYFKGEFLA